MKITKKPADLKAIDSLAFGRRLAYLAEFQKQRRRYSGADNPGLALSGTSTGLAATTLDDVAKDETQAALPVRAGLTGLDGSAAVNTRNRPIEARAAVGEQAFTLYRALVDGLARAVDVTRATYPVLAGSSVETAGYMALLGMEARKAGYYDSYRGRRYSCKSPNLTGVAAATSFVATTPTFLLVAGATNELLIKKIKVALPAIGTSTTFRAVVKTDTADRFSAGGSARAPATWNNGNVVATTVARNLETPTATAEGGGTRDIWPESGQITSGSEILFDFEDGLIIAAGGSLLLYVVTATAGATVDYAIEFEDANVQ